MFLKGSRYEAARAFDSPPSGEQPFPGVRPRPVTTPEGVIEHTVQAGDRLDLLARHYYNDDRLWWRIVDANPEISYGHDALRDKPALDDAGEELLASMVGKSLRIPRGRT